MFSKNKLLIILFVFILFFTIILNHSNVFASQIVTYNDIKYTIPDFPDDGNNYKILFVNIVSENYASFVLFTSSEPFFIDINKGTCKYSNYLYYSYRTDHVEGPFSLNSSFSQDTAGKSTSELYKRIVYSNYDVTDEEGNLVFQGAPVTVEQVTIPEISQVTEIPQVIAEVLKILIPIGLIVLSIGLVIYLTRLVISRLQ